MHSVNGSRTAIAPVDPVSDGDDTSNSDGVNGDPVDDGDDASNGDYVDGGTDDGDYFNDNVDNGDVVNGGDDNVSGVDGNDVKCGRTYIMQQKPDDTVADMEHAWRMREIEYKMCETYIHGFRDTHKRQIRDI